MSTLEKLQFKISSALKNIIGKDLIIDDYIAIFELVKNSYDAHASQVDITFKTNSIIIQDNGKGMSKDDLLKKWLFVAYSAKELGIEDLEFNDESIFNEEIDYRDKIENNRIYAGAKGIGRFSCDRLGKRLRLISRKTSESSYHQLDVDWGKFEENPENEFVDIAINYSRPSEEKILEYKKFEHGVILEINFLRDTWKREQKLELKNSLGKLINPFENKLMPSFQIILHDKDELYEDKNEEYDRRKVNGLVKNTVIDILNIKTTNIEVHIEKEKITTTLTDRGELIYKIEEQNIYKFLHNIHFRLFFLNRAAKNNFKRQMGVPSVQFGSVFLYNNGFRVYPFGDEGDDSLKIDRRHQQGFKRFLGTRDLLGSIEILQKSDYFKETTSRDGGLILSDATEELFDAFYENVLKRLEKYVVGIQWAFIDDENLVYDKDREDISLLNTVTSKEKIIHLISRLVDDPNTKLLQYNKNFLNIVNEKLSLNSPKILQTLQQLAIKTNDENFITEIETANKKILDLQKSVVIAEEQTKQAFENQWQAEKRADKAEHKVKEVEREKQIVEQDNIQKEKQILFLQSERTLSEEDLINLQHHIGINAELIDGSITNFKRKMDKKEIIDKSEVMEILDEISITNQKILAINKYATKADFITNSESIHNDLIAFIQQYIENIYKIVSDNKINIQIENSNLEFVIDFKPMEITIIIDNILSNAKKARANNMLISFSKDQNNLEIKFIDDGIGLGNHITNTNALFERGYTTTKGSGLGLHHIQQLVKSMNGMVTINKNKIKGISLLIRLVK